MANRFVVLCLASIAQVEGHTRLECPPPLSGATGAKIGPCDVNSDDTSVEAYALSPGFNTITWIESLAHPGAPARFALSQDGEMDGFEQCILLDHVPHDECSQANQIFSQNYHAHAVTLYIPDVNCTRCFLQLITFMTDDHGHMLSPGTSCAYGRAQDAGLADDTIDDCKVVYHSCAPVSINGTVPRADHTCDLSTYETELEWPAELAEKPPSTYYYKGDPGIYNKEGQLVVGGEPLDGCNDFWAWFFTPGAEFHCGAQYVTEKFKANLTAPYNTQYGTCPRQAPNHVVDDSSGECVPYDVTV